MVDFGGWEVKLGMYTVMDCVDIGAVMMELAFCLGHMGGVH